MKRREAQPYYDALHSVVSACPHCATFAPGIELGRTVIYRMSNRSVTMRCEVCSLQWTMTLHRISEMAKRVVGEHDDEWWLRPQHEAVARMFARDFETRGRRTGAHTGARRAGAAPLSGI
jgi:hypothetical protein